MQIALNAAGIARMRTIAELKKEGPVLLHRLRYSPRPLRIAEFSSAIPTRPHRGMSMNQIHKVSPDEIRLALQRLKKYDGAMSPQHYKTIRGQIISGNIAGAEKGLERVLKGMKSKYGI